MGCFFDCFFALISLTQTYSLYQMSFRPQRQRRGVEKSKQLFLRGSNGWSCRAVEISPQPWANSVARTSWVCYLVYITCFAIQLLFGCACTIFDQSPHTETGSACCRNDSRGLILWHEHLGSVIWCIPRVLLYSFYSGVFAQFSSKAPTHRNRLRLRSK